MLIRTIFAATFLLSTLLSGVARADQTADREKLLGTWQVEAGGTHETWSIDTEGENLRVVRTAEGKATLDLQCKPVGADCNGTDEGKRVSVTMYFNGTALVQMETKDSYVTKRKFILAGGMDRMTIEITPITGPGKQQTLQLTRSLQAAGR